MITYLYFLYLMINRNRDGRYLIDGSLVRHWLWSWRNLAPRLCYLSIKHFCFPIKHRMTRLQKRQTIYVIIVLIQDILFMYWDAPCIKRAPLRVCCFITWILRGHGTAATACWVRTQWRVRRWIEHAVIREQMKISYLFELHSLWVWMCIHMFAFDCASIYIGLFQSYICIYNQTNMAIIIWQVA